MAVDRMNKEQFFAKLSSLDSDQRDKILWNLYWRGSAAVRERIEGELDPKERAQQTKAAAKPPDPDEVLAEVREFAELAHSGAYLGGDRRVKPSERTKWRVTFRRLATGAQSALHAADSGPAEEAMELMIDLACVAQGCFRSDDPLEAARFVVPDAAYALWQTVLDVHGADEFPRRALPQLIRWEREYGWSEGTDACKVREAERPLPEILSPMLSTPEMWLAAADAYLAELDRVAAGEAPPEIKKNTRAWRDWQNGEYYRKRNRKDRADNLARWNTALLPHLDDERAGRLAGHAAFAGPEAEFLKAQAARQRGDVLGARELIKVCLKTYPGNGKFRAFADDVGLTRDEA